MTHTASELATLISGRLIGPPDTPVTAAASAPAEATPSEVSFVENEKNLRLLRECRAGVLVVPKGVADRVGEFAPPGHAFTLIEAADPLLAFVRIVRHFRGGEPVVAPGIHPSAVIDPTAVLGEGCTVEAFVSVAAGAVIGKNCHLHAGTRVGRDCRVGDDSTLYANVVLYERSVLGRRAIVHAGAVIGADGFGYRFAGGRHVKVPQLGHVEIGDDVEVGACTTIDRGTFGPTRVGDGTKIDNLVQIAHNVRLGQHNLIISQVGIAGSSTTGNYVVIAGQVGVADHVTIHDGAMIGAGSAVPQDVPAGAKMLGYPVRPERDAKRILLSMSHLPELVKDVRTIKKQLGIGTELKEAG